MRSHTVYSTMMNLNRSWTLLREAITFVGAFMMYVTRGRAALSLLFNLAFDPMGGGTAVFGSAANVKRVVAFVQSTLR